METAFAVTVSYATTGSVVVAVAIAVFVAVVVVVVVAQAFPVTFAVTVAVAVAVFVAVCRSLVSRAHELIVVDSGHLRTHLSLYAAIYLKPSRLYNETTFFDWRRSTKTFSKKDFMKKKFKNSFLK